MWQIKGRLFRRNPSLHVKNDCDISIESILTVQYETSGITFQNMGSDALLGFDEGHPHSKKSDIASKISTCLLGEKKCNQMQIFHFLKP